MEECKQVVVTKAEQEILLSVLKKEWNSANEDHEMYKKWTQEKKDKADTLARAYNTVLNAKTYTPVKVEAAPAPKKELLSFPIPKSWDGANTWIGKVLFILSEAQEFLTAPQVWEMMLIKDPALKEKYKVMPTAVLTSLYSINGKRMLEIEKTPNKNPCYKLKKGESK